MRRRQIDGKIIMPRLQQGQRRGQLMPEAGAVIRPHHRSLCPDIRGVGRHTGRLKDGVSLAPVVPPRRRVQRRQTGWRNGIAQRRKQFPQRGRGALPMFPQALPCRMAQRVAVQRRKSNGGGPFFLWRNDGNTRSGIGFPARKGTVAAVRVPEQQDHAGMQPLRLAPRAVQRIPDPAPAVTFPAKGPHVAQRHGTQFLAGRAGHIRRRRIARRTGLR